MIVHIPILDHDQLHTEIPPLPVMSANLARVAFSHFEETNIGMGRRRGLDMFDSLTDRFNVTSKGMGKVATEAGMFAEQFTDQRVHFGRAI